MRILKGVLLCVGSGVGGGEAGVRARRRGAPAARAGRPLTSRLTPHLQRGYCQAVHQEELVNNVLLKVFVTISKWGLNGFSNRI